MYETYWQLQQKPFENCADPRFYYPGESPQAALLKLRYAVENHRGGGAFGRRFGHWQDAHRRHAPQPAGRKPHALRASGFPANEHRRPARLFGRLLGRRTICTVENHGVQNSIQRIEHFLTENNRKDRHAVIVIDEAHLITRADTWEAIRLLMNFETDGQPALSLLLSGQTALLPMLDRMPQLDERLGVKCLLRPFTVEETAAYAAHRLKTAGAKRTIIDRDAFTTLHELTDGIARRINRLCDSGPADRLRRRTQNLKRRAFRIGLPELVTIAPE